MTTPTNNYIDGELSKLDNSDMRNGAKASLVLFGATSGKTKQLSITKDQLQAVNTVLRHDGSGDEAHQAQQESLGKALAELLGLKKDKDGRFNTSGGTKTERGLGATVMRLLSEVNA